MKGLRYDLGVAKQTLLAFGIRHLAFGIWHLQRSL